MDDDIRLDMDMKSLATPKPALARDGPTTAGNASQVNDDARGALHMKRSLAMKRGFPILGLFRCYAAMGVEPGVIGVGPAVTIQITARNAGLEVADIDLFEINEMLDAFQHLR